MRNCVVLAQILGEKDSKMDDDRYGEFSIDVEDQEEFWNET